MPESTRKSCPKESVLAPLDVRESECVLLVELIGPFGDCHFQVVDTAFRSRDQGMRAKKYRLQYRSLRRLNRVSFFRPETFGDVVDDVVLFVRLILKVYRLERLRRLVFGVIGRRFDLLY